MFILRRISSHGVEMNFIIGNSYTIVTRFENYEDFKKSFKLVFGKDHVADLDKTSDSDDKNCFAFVSTENGDKIYPLWMNQSNYIMTENGKTFSRIWDKNGL